MGRHWGRYKAKKDIRHGVAIVFAHMTQSGVTGWMLPGMRFTNVEEEARLCAQRMDKIMRANLLRLGDRGKTVAAAWSA